MGGQQSGGGIRNPSGKPSVVAKRPESPGMEYKGSNARREGEYCGLGGGPSTAVALAESNFDVESEMQKKVLDLVSPLPAISWPTVLVAG